MWQLRNGRINMFFQLFGGIFFRFSSLNPLAVGGVNSKSHLSHDWSTSLWKTYAFFDVFGVVMSFRQFKIELKRWFKTVLVFFFVSHQIFLLTEWVGFQICLTFCVAVEFF